LGTLERPRSPARAAAIWAETIADFDDLSFLLLPRLPGAAHKAWSEPHSATWSDHRDRLAWHGRLWDQSDLAYFRASINWR
jgi:hexosaminidase